MSDPYAASEASRYEHPVASRKWLMELLEEAGRPLDYDELVWMTNTVEDNRDALFARLKAMTRDGQIITDRVGPVCVGRSCGSAVWTCGGAS